MLAYAEELSKEEENFSPKRQVLVRESIREARPFSQGNEYF